MMHDQRQKSQAHNQLATDLEKMDSTITDYTDVAPILDTTHLFTSDAIQRT